MRNKYLSNNILNLYDFNLAKNKVAEVFDLFNYLEMTYENIPLPSITSSGNVRYEQFLPEIKSSKVENFVFKKICFEIKGSDYKRKKLMSKIKLALDRLNKNERLVFKYIFFDELSIEEICDNLHYCDKKINSIKKSAIIKFLVALGIDDLCLKGGDKLRVQSYFQNKARATL